MQPDASPADTRLTREEAYWNDVYRASGSEHHKYLWVKRLEQHSYVGEYFLRRASRFREKRILSLGGGIDYLAVSLARADNRVVTVDVSPVAAVATVELARQEGVADRVQVLVGASEEIALGDDSFDVVLSKRALHHMDVERTVGRVRDLLIDGGSFLAEEPICLSAGLKWIHEKFPFHPTAPRTPDERELTDRDLTFIQRSFREASVSYFDLLGRESVAYVLEKLRMDWVLNPLGRLDDLLMNRSLPFLRSVATYAIIEASK